MPSYLVPFWITAASLLLMVAGHSVPGVDAAWRTALFSLPATILVFAIPCCLFVLCEWLRTGEFPELTWEPLRASPEEKELHRKWRERPKLDDEAFYQAFYAESQIPKKLVADVRRELVSALGLSLAAHPADNLGAACPDVDLADVFFRFDRVFGIKIPWRSQSPEELGVDGSFDSLLRLVHRLRTAGDARPHLADSAEPTARLDDSP